MKKKRLFGLLLSLALMLGMMPALGISMPAYAAAPVIYDLWVGDIAVTSENAGNITGSPTPTASYDAAARTLTLTDYSNNGQAHNYGSGSAAIYTDLDLTIVLNGKNTVQNTSDGGIGIYAKKDLTIRGSGELAAAGGNNINNCGIQAAGNVAIENGKITSEGYFAILSDKMINIKDGEVTANGKAEGIHALSSLIINDGKVTAAATTGESSAINSEKNVSINGGEVTATATSDKDESYGISGDEKVTISGGTVKATAKSNNTSDSKSSYGIYSSDNNVTISSGNVTADAVSAAGSSYGISSYSQNVKISGGNVTASAASRKSGESHGIWSEFNDVEISGGKVTASAASESGKSYGIRAAINLGITGGEVTAEATSDDNLSSDNHSLGISAYASNVTISGGTVTSTATVKSGSGKGYGIIAGKIVTISSGTVISTATANSDSYGIYAEREDVFFEGGDVTASGKTAVHTRTDEIRVYLGDGVIVKAGANAGSATDVTSTFANNHDQAWAHIMEAVCIVSFDANGHGKAPAAQIIANGGKVTKPDDPSEGGWTFDGWYKEKRCVNAWNFDTDTVTRSMTLYAKWEDDSTEEVKKVVEMISALPAPEKVTVNDEKAITEARAAYDDLSGKQKSDPSLTPALKNKLADCEAALAEAKKSTDEKAAEAVSKDIKTLPKSPAKADATKARSVMAEYDKLTAAQKALIDDDLTYQISEYKYFFGKKDAAVRKASLSSVKAMKGRKAQVTWKKSSEATGYQLVYSTSKKFTGKTTKKVTVKSNATVKKTVKKLKAGKKYYFRVRTYTSVHNPITDKNENIAGKWSKVKKTKAK